MKRNIGIITILVGVGLFFISIIFSTGYYGKSYTIYGSFIDSIPDRYIVLKEGKYVAGEHLGLKYILSHDALDLYSIDRLLRLSDSLKYSSSVEELFALVDSSKYNQDAIIKPQDAFVAGVAINQKNYMAVEQGKLPILPDVFSISDINKALNKEQNFQLDDKSNKTLNQLDIYNRVKTALESPEVIKNIDDVAKDFSMLDKEQQYKLLNSLNKEYEGRIAIPLKYMLSLSIVLILVGIGVVLLSKNNKTDRQQTH